MSADSFVVYYGVRRKVAEDEVEQCETRKHPWIRAARDVGLQHYWSNFSIEGAEDYQLFVGRQIGVFGAEGIAQLQVSDSEFECIVQDTKLRLGRAGISETPALHIQYGPDFERLTPSMGS